MIDKIGYFNDSTICTSDYEFSLKALDNNIVIRNSDIDVIKYRIHEGSLSNSFRFGIVNEERERNLRRIRKLYPFYYRIEFKYLDFFEKEISYFAGKKREIVEKWMLEYIAMLVKMHKIENIGYLFHLLDQTKHNEEEKKDIQFLLYLSSGKEKEARSFYIKNRENLLPKWSYLVASTCKSLGRHNFAEQVFKAAATAPGADENIISGVHFHLGEIYFKDRAYEEAETEFKKCLHLNKEHKAAAGYLKKIQTQNG
ncbi:MAG: hypothetical protein GY950_06625 [bacterium]|nr:hypothetical protein [bacterium]